MKFIIALLIVFWWIALWNIFDIYTEDKTKNEKLCIYFIMLGIVIAVLCLFPEFVNHLY